jgi:hypothetical protein
VHGAINAPGCMLLEKKETASFGSPCVLAKTGAMKRKKRSSFCEGKVPRLIKCEAGDKCHPASGIVAFHHEEVGHAGGQGIRGKWTSNGRHLVAST